jgi:uncharacterized protein YkwD
MPLTVDVASGATADCLRVEAQRIKVAVAVAIVAVAGAFAAPVGSSGNAKTHVALTSLESGVLQQLNKIRVQHGLVPVKISARLTSAAEQHSTEMGADGYFEHNSHDGTAFWKRINRWYASSGYGYWSVGENLLWSSPDVEPAHALELWMNSPEHRANILAARWREIGVAAVHVHGAPGDYHGLDVTIITTDFGVRH